MCVICDELKRLNSKPAPESIQVRFNRMYDEFFGSAQPAKNSAPDASLEAGFELARDAIAAIESSSIIQRAKSSRVWGGEVAKNDAFAKAVLLKTAELLTVAAEGMPS